MPNSISDSILALLKQQLDNTSLLAKVIDDEYQALIKRDSDTLNQLVQDKQSLLAQIEQQDLNIQQHPEASALTDQSAQDVQQILNEIKQQFITCQQQNSVNGELIEMSLRTTQHLAGVLNQAKAANSLTYDAKGQARGGSLLGKGIKA
ncbi:MULTISPECIES: flagellar protein FlgN [unclassified Motilimonas]|uniref:flagella synthesis protein FlgN n=1 Tax=Motilimonas TaxID=1914248 RepID=UPI001E3A847F|nr:MULTISPECIES: flagellar protein FlgN [unclassified Motilimonas]MCE0556190.1 flagellar protein FlgN [Motilimonas sp. E26]MDO6524936.1 flagellar protein FlgN [Motilimonas sp. 1_MG-2023]